MIIKIIKLFREKERERERKIERERETGMPNDFWSDRRFREKEHLILVFKKHQLLLFELSLQFSYSIAFWRDGLLLLC